MVSLSVLNFIVDGFFKIFPFLPHKSKDFESFKEQFVSIAFQEDYCSLNKNKINSLMTYVFGTNVHSDGLIKLRVIKQHHLHRKDKKLVEEFIELFDKMIKYEELEKSGRGSYREKMNLGNEIQYSYNDIKRLMKNAHMK